MGALWADRKARTGLRVDREKDVKSAEKLAFLGFSFAFSSIRLSIAGLDERNRDSEALNQGSRLRKRESESVNLDC